MKKLKVAIAALLSVGMILGTTDAALAVIATPKSMISATTYKSYLLTYKNRLVAFHTATANLKIQLLIYATASQRYSTSSSKSLKAYKAVLKSVSPGSTADQYAFEVSAYNRALTAYNTNVASNKKALKVLQIFAAKYETSYRDVLRDYQAMYKMREQLKQVSNLALIATVHKAKAVFVSSMSKATTATQKSMATNLYHASINAAVASRKATIGALGYQLIKPIKMDTKIGDQSYNFKAIRPIRPTKPENLSAGLTAKNF